MIENVHISAQRKKLVKEKSLHDEKFCRGVSSKYHEKLFKCLFYPGHGASVMKAHVCDPWIHCPHT